MDILDIFSGDAFSSVTLSDAVQRNPYLPQGLGAMNLFKPNPIRTTSVAIESRQGALTLVGFSERGAPGQERTTEQRKMFTFKVPRLMHEDTITVAELQNIRAFGTTDIPMQVEAEVARRLSGETGLLASLEYSKEAMRLAAIGGLCIDPKTGSVLFDFNAEFGITQNTQIAFDFANAPLGHIRQTCNQITRAMARKAQGAFLPTTEVIALCSPEFFDALVTSPEVRQTYLNWSAAADLRGNTGGAFSKFSFAGVSFIDYRGSDNLADIVIPAGTCRIFPDAAGLYQHVMAPGESADFLNEPGRDVYVLPIIDTQRRTFFKMEAYSYPLMLPVRPEVLFSARAGA